jgi:hypothetical protein
MNTYLLVAIALSVLLTASIYFNYRFARIIFSYEDSLENCLDTLDKSYGKISEILQIPLFADTPQIKQVMNEIEISRQAILYVANQIASVEDEEEEI